MYFSNRSLATYRKLTRFASKDSMDSASLATSQYSSAMSLNYGSYTLDSQPEARRCCLLYLSNFYIFIVVSNRLAKVLSTCNPFAIRPDPCIFCNGSPTPVASFAVNNQSHISNQISNNDVYILTPDVSFVRIVIHV